MLNLHKSYIYDESNNRIAIILPIKEFEKIEEILEDHGLAKLIDETKNEETLSVFDAKKYYGTLNKDVEN